MKFLRRNNHTIYLRLRVSPLPNNFLETWEVFAIYKFFLLVASKFSSRYSKRRSTKAAHIVTNLFVKISPTVDSRTFRYQSFPAGFFEEHEGCSWCSAELQYSCEIHVRFEFFFALVYLYIENTSYEGRSGVLIVDSFFRNYLFFFFHVYRLIF